jgi:hypothetical protein
MTADSVAGIPVTFAKGVLEDVRELTAISSEEDREYAAEAEALKQRIAELLVGCKGNPFPRRADGSGAPSRACQLPSHSVRHSLVRREASLPPDLPQ